ncbi:MAG: glycosyltransferase family 39 protein [Clostridia bacterium]|nr:glycosyltransferase family 39 protein [Clostridia bacterium]
MYGKIVKITENAVKILILGLWSLIMFGLFVVCTIRTVDLIGGMDIYFWDDSLLENLLWLVVAYVIMTGILLLTKRYVQQNVLANIVRNKDKVGIVVTTVVTIFLIWWIYITQYEPLIDQMACLQHAKELLEGNFKDWKTGYMSVYPFQNGIVFFDALLIRLFGDNAFIAFQYINVLFFIIAVIAVYVTCNYMFKKEKSVFVWLALVTFYPFAMYVVFCYGTMIGFSLAMVAVMFLFMYFDKRKLWYLVLCGISITLSLIMKTNYAIVLVGIALYLLFDMVVTKKMKSVAGLVIVLAVYFAGSKGMNLAVEVVTNMPVAEGMPKIAWIAMGMNDSNNTAGWYDTYSGYVYDKNNRDREATIEECKEHIRLRQEILVGKRFIKFYYQKITSQWNNPTWECFNLQWRDSNTPDYAIKKTVQEGNNQFYKDILNVLQTLVNFGAVLYIIRKWKNFKSLSVYELFNAVLMIGAFVFFAIWEAKSQYVAPYYFLIIPYSVIGWKAATTKTAGMIEAFAAERKKGNAKK